MVAMNSETFAKDRLPGGKVVGKFDMDKVNTLGGSLALGHPFGATGTMLCVRVMCMAMRMHMHFCRCVCVIALDCCC
jgi:acetyl-CoA acetyltransferase